MPTQYRHSTPDGAPAERAAAWGDLEGIIFTLTDLPVRVIHEPEPTAVPGVVKVHYRAGYGMLSDGWHRMSAYLVTRDPDLDRLADLIAARHALDAAEGEVARLRSARDDLVREMIAEGVTAYSIAQTLGISHQAVAKIRKAG